MPNRPFADVVAQLVQLAREASIVSRDITDRQKKRARNDIEGIVDELATLTVTLDPIQRPLSFFDPTDPATAGQMIALTMLAQHRHPLGAVPAFYGSGVYALYYTGDFDLYQPLAGTEQPIYVGKANPDTTTAKDAVAQGAKLAARLNEHAKSVRKARNLSIDDFEARMLVVQSGYQEAAERSLITFFKPIWNNEQKICFGIGKHGDKATTRVNARSPWDTLHPGRHWADDIELDQFPEATIRANVAAHFAAHPPYDRFDAIFAEFASEMRQFDPVD